jgi:hypothetical protein
VHRWLFLHSIDGLVVNTSRSLTYSYILAPLFFQAVKITSEILILCGIYRFAGRLIEPTLAPNRYDQFPLLLVQPCLWLAGLYYVFLSFGLAFSWLSFADPRAIEQLARGLSDSRWVYAMMQFLASLLLLFLDFSWKRGLYDFEPGFCWVFRDTYNDVVRDATSDSEALLALLMAMARKSVWRQFFHVAQV